MERRQTLAAIARVGALGAATGLLLATGITNPTTIALPVNTRIVSGKTSRPDRVV